MNNPSHSEDPATGQTPESASTYDSQNSASNPAEEGETIESLKQKLAEAEKQILLAHADLENFRKRTRKEMQDQIRYASVPLISELLEALDNLERAIGVARSDTDSRNSQGLLEGVTMVAEQLQNILQQHGCQRIEAQGQPFDPNHHQAVQLVPSDEHEPNTVIQEVRPGFRLHDRVIRPSQVLVSQQKS